MNPDSFLHQSLRSVRKAGRLVIAALLGLVGHAAVCQAATPTYVEGRVIVTFKPAGGLDDAKAVLGRKSLALSKHFGFLSAKRNRTTGLVKHPTKTTAQLMADLKDDPAVESVEPDYLRWVKAVPNDTRFASMWGLQNTGQAIIGTTGTAGDDVKFVEAWSLANPSASNVVVGVIDTGTNYVHPDLAANMWVNTGEIQGNGKDDDHNGYVDDYFGYDFANGKPDPVDTADASDPTSIIYHGTHVSGIIAATGNNQLGTIGVNYHAKIMALKVSSDGSSINTSAEIAAIEYATMMKGKGVNIVALNASFGGPSFSSTEQAAIQAAGDAGIVFCAAAGNGDARGNPVNNDTTPTYPAGYRLANMIVVAATNQDDALASFSNYGATTVDIAAPGTSILSTQPGSSPVLTVGSNNYDFGSFTYSPAATGVSGAIYDCGLGYAADFPAAVKGNVALISRGTLNFSVKVANAMTAGATAVIIYNNAAGEINGTLGSAGSWIPSLAISQADGQAIKHALPLSCNVTSVPGYTYLDGTSMATPHVTGAVSYAAANFPNDTVAQRIRRVLDNVDVKPSLQGKVVTNGRLNLLRIVDANQNGIPDWLEPSGANPPSISTPATLADGLAGTSYSQTLAATGGTSPYSWNVISGALPAGLTLSKDGVLSGTPTMPGNSSFVVVVTDNAGSANGASLALTIADPPLSISSGPQLANGTANAPYQATLQATGGTRPYSWTLSNSTLPASLTLDGSGNLTGTPTTFGTYQFTAQVEDVGGLTQSQVFTLTIDPLPLVISTGGTLPTGILNVAYTQPLNASGGAGSYVWSLNSGSLPDGLNLDPSGSITGTPTTPGTSTFELQVQDGASRTKTQSFTLAIDLSALIISIPSTVSSTSTPAPLNPGVKGVPYLAESLSVSGGTPPYAWTLNTGSYLPPGLKLTSTGLIGGTPTAAGIFTFTATVTDKLLLAQSQPLQVTVTSTYVRPVVSSPALGTTTVGVLFSYTVSASNYPKTFAITGLPPGLAYSTTTGIISGRPTVGGTFPVKVTATNPGGTSLPVNGSLIVNGLDTRLVGSFTGLVGRDPAVNNNLGSRLSLTTSSAGAYTAKITTGAITKSVLGYLATTTPQISVTVGTALLQLTLDSSSSTLSGTWGTAAVTGCRQTWSAIHPATSRAGYYSIGLDLADLADQGAAGVPQGSSYASFSVATTGTLTVSGRTADGQVITCATIIGPNGEMPVYVPLYSNLGSLTGTLSLATPSAALEDNTATGTLTWFKPTTSNTRTYRSTFGPTHLTAQGMYLAKAASGQIVLGLPATGLANLLFTEGGLSASAIDPDVTGFTYTAAHTIVLPKAGVTGNLGKATLVINKNTGLFTGTFTLVETTPKLTRTVAFQGIIVRPASGTTKGEGYFLVAQIPATGQTILTSPALSGKVVIDQ